MHFCNLKLDSASREATTFTTHESLHRFERLNFGTKLSEILQTKMDEILGNLLKCMAIADNVTLFAISFDTMHDTLDKVFNQFLECGITLNKQKSELFINISELMFHNYVHS